MTIIDAGLQFNSGHDVRIGAPRDIVLHHAVSNGSVQNIHAGHKNRGWIGIGYHFYVRKDGSVYRGRPENWIGAHAVGHNTGIGICAEGNFMNDTMGDAQKKSIIEVIAYLLDKYGALPIRRHKDVDATACPGTNYPFNEIVKAAAELGGVDAETVVDSTLRNGCAGEAVEELQKNLTKLGYDCGGADGIFGNLTETAAKKFQSDAHITVDGIVGDETVAAIEKAMKAVPVGGGAVPEVVPEPEEYTLDQFIRDVQSVTGSAVDGIAGTQTIGNTVTVSRYINRTHKVVKPIQKRLAALGYTEVGEADGVAGPMFDKAMKHFQRDNGCIVDGEATRRKLTWQKLLGMK